MAYTPSDPIVFQPNVNNVEQSFRKTQNQLNDLYGLISDVGALNLSGTKRQSVLHGSTDASGNPNYLTSSGLSVSITGPLILAFANGFNNSGSVDLVDTITGTISSAYTIPANQTVYLYVDKDINTGLLSYGYTSLADQYLKAAPSSPVLDQHYFNTNEMKMYRYNGSAWEVKQRIFLGKAVSDGSTVTLTIYPFESKAASIGRLSTPRKINNVAFDGTSDITITQVNGKDIATVDQISANYDVAHALTTNGYQKFSNGLILQWGYCAAGFTNPVTFPIAFPGACFTALGVPVYPEGTYRNAKSWTKTSLTMSDNYVAMAWFAIGN